MFRRGLPQALLLQTSRKHTINGWPLEVESYWLIRNGASYTTHTNGASEIACKLRSSSIIFPNAISHCTTASRCEGCSLDRTACFKHVAMLPKREKENGGRNVVVANRIFCPLIISLGHFLQFSGKSPQVLQQQQHVLPPDLIECRLSVSRYSGCPFRNTIFARIDCEIYFACLHASTQVIPNQSMSLFV